MISLQKTLGFIGSGNMALAIIRGVLARGLVTPDKIVVSDANPDQVARVADAAGVTGVAGNCEVAEAADVVVLATKPQHVSGVMQEIREHLDPKRHVIVSICAGITTAAIEAAAGVEGLQVVRVMPNTPALISCGSAAIAAGTFVDAASLGVVTQVFDSVGTSVVVDEVKLDAVTGVSGSGPAYVFRFIEGLIAAAREQGLTEEEAQILVPQMVRGAARMAVEDGRSLEELRRAVTTPGGTTAAGLQVLEEQNFLQILSECVGAATSRSRELAGS